MFLSNHSSKGWLTINIRRIICTETVADKLSSKHRVSVDETRQLLLNQPRFRFAEKGDVPDEDVYAAFGQTYGGRYLVVFFVYKPTKTVAIVISARDMTSAERRRYGRK